MTNHRVDLRHADADYCTTSTLTESVSGFTVKSGDQITLYPTIGDSGDGARAENVNNWTTSGLFPDVTTNCSVSNPGGGLPGDPIVITPTSNGAYTFKRTFIYTIDSSLCSGTTGTPSIVRSFQVSGTRVAGAGYGLQVFNANGEKRLDFSKRNLRVHGYVTGSVPNTSYTTYNVSIPGLGYPTVNDWLVIQRRAGSLYWPDAITTAATSPTNNGVLRLKRSNTGSNTWQNPNFAHQAYMTVFTAIDTQYELALLRI